MKIAICDDQEIYLNYLKKLIETYYMKSKEEVIVEMFPSAEAMLFQLGETIPYDLVILDIQMGEMNGMELAKIIRRRDPHVFIVFITGITDYVYDGYEVEALRYLLKPLKEAQLYSILDEIKSRLASKEIRYHIFQINGEKVKINLDDLLYLEALGHYVLLHTKTNTFEVKSSLNQLLKEINSEVLITVHRSFVVNIKHVEKITKETCFLTNNKHVSVSRSNYQLLNEKFISYIRGQKHD